MNGDRILILFLLICLFIYNLIFSIYINNNSCGIDNVVENNSKKLFISIGDELMPNCFVEYIDYQQGQIICSKKEGV
jgi:hypothetical protein